MKGGRVGEAFILTARKVTSRPVSEPSKKQTKTGDAQSCGSRDTPSMYACKEAMRFSGSVAKT
jgi:hypothetical protein